MADFHFNFDDWIIIIDMKMKLDKKYEGDGGGVVVVQDPKYSIIPLDKYSYLAA